MKLRTLPAAVALGAAATACNDDTPKPVPEAHAEPWEPETEATLEPITDPDSTRELGPAAKRILEEHSEDPIGTEIPFEHEGRPYVARIELHDNPDGDPGRPLGKHKGVSVYAVSR